MNAEIKTEMGISVEVMPNHLTPSKTATFYNPKMSINRELVLCVLDAFLSTRQDQNINDIPDCLDAFAATGMMGLIWKKIFQNQAYVTINDISKPSVEHITKNVVRNLFTLVQSEGAEKLSASTVVEVTQKDANVILHERPFDFIHLDPYGSAVQFLDAAFRNVRTGGIVSVTSTDLASLYGKCPQVTLRNYGSRSIKTDYTKELAARIVIAAIARAAARCNKGIKLLLTVAIEHLVLIAVRIERGSPNADKSLHCIQQLLHCPTCEDKAFLPGPASSASLENPYDYLGCTCHKTLSGHAGVILGPLWSGNLFNSTFIGRMLKAAEIHGCSLRTHELLSALHSESVCSSSLPNVDLTSEYSCKDRTVRNGSGSVTLEQRDSLTRDGDGIKSRHSVGACKRTAADTNSDDMSFSKKSKLDVNPSDDDCPAFYFDTHRHTEKGKNVPKMKCLLSALVKRGYRASRTHFDAHAVRTSASLQEFKEIVEECGKLETSKSSAH